MFPGRNHADKHFEQYKAPGSGSNGIIMSIRWVVASSSGILRDTFSHSKVFSQYSSLMSPFSGVTDIDVSWTSVIAVFLGTRRVMRVQRTFGIFTVGIS